MSVYDHITRCPSANFAWCFALLVLWVCIPTVVNRLQIAASGVVIDSVTRYEPRRVVYYTLQSPDGGQKTLISGPTDASLPRDLPRGTQINKQRWHIGYSLNHVHRTGFPLGFYISGFLVAVASIALGIRLWCLSAPPRRVI
jgi:hypothetical protein